LEYDKFLLDADHCCLWIDLSFNNAFGHNIPSVARPKTRQLNCKDPQTVQNYVRHYKLLAKKHNLLEKIQTLANKSSYPLPLHLQLEYKKKDNLHCEIMTASVKSVKNYKRDRSTSPQKYSLCPDKYLINKYFSRRKTSSRLLLRSMKNAGITTTLSSLSHLQEGTNLCLAHQHYWQIRKSHKEL
jgi:hypothetical protein